MTTNPRSAIRGTVRGPRDVPGLRAHLLEQWKSDTLRYPQLEVSPTGEVLQSLTGDGRWDREVLSNPEISYWYVSTPMCDVLTAAEVQLPDDTVLERELLPREYGLVVFERPLFGIDSDANNPDAIHVDALMWGPVLLVPTVHYRDARVGLGIASYRRLRLGDGLRPDEMTALIGSGAATPLLEAVQATGVTWQEVHHDVWVPLGRSDWVLNEPVTHEHMPVLDASALASMIEDRRRLATFWLLTGQEGVTSTGVDHGSRAERRQAERHHEPQPTVRVVDVKHAAAARNDELDDDSERRHLTVRFIVSGHWRKQWYPSTQSHRPVWIHAHWRGPDDGPISGTEKVRIWR